MAEAILNIQLSSGTSSPNVGDTGLISFTGGPSVLLKWLESQLGLLREMLSFTQRVTEYSEALNSVSGACYEKSLETDRWSTASELLLRRDQLMLEGWDGKSHADFPRLVKDLVKVEAASEINCPNVATRLHGIIAALDAGQELLPHVVQLGEDVGLWPGLWRDVLRRLNVNVGGVPVPSASPGNALTSVQEQCVSGHLKRRAAISLQNSEREEYRTREHLLYNGIDAAYPASVGKIRNE